jgi:hypothetical protein
MEVVGLDINKECRRPARPPFEHRAHMLGTPLSSHCWKYLTVLEFQRRKIEVNRECPANAISYNLTGDATSVASPSFRLNNKRAVAGFRLLLCSNHTNANRLALPLWVFSPRLLCLLLRLERLRQRCELSVDVLEQQPLLHDFGHGVL